MKIFRLFFLLTLILVSAYFGWQTYQQEKQNQTLTDDLVVLKDVKYGLFNADKWKEIFSDVIASKMNEFTLENTDEEEFKTQIGIFLEEMIEKFQKSYTEQNSGGGLSGLLIKTITSSSRIFDNVKKDIPKFSEDIYHFLTQGGSQKMMARYVRNELDKYTKDTFKQTDYSYVNFIVKKYNVDGINETVVRIEEEIEKNYQSKTLNWSVLIICFSLLLISLLFFIQKTNIEYILFTFYSLILLFLGVFLPMISIDARISKLNFTFLDEKIQFIDQVLIYKSKSITEVVEILFAQNRLDLLFVGVLILLFSVLFPVSKSMGSLAFIGMKKLKENKIIQFLVFKTGKWSMADVFVIALFMAYLGFDGLLTDQMKLFNTSSETIKILSTSKSELLFGFYAFTGFVLFSLSISSKVKKLHTKNP